MLMAIHSSYKLNQVLRLPELFAMGFAYTGTASECAGRTAHAPASLPSRYIMAHTSRARGVTNHSTIQSLSLLSQCFSLF